MTSGGRFNFDDGGSYCGGWAEGKAHGFGVCTGPKGQGHYDGAWYYGFEVSGTYTWPSGNDYEGQWNLGKRHGLGVENKGRWVYKGDWTHGFKGRYGVRYSTTSGAKYEGTWSTGLQDGYGVETYADGGTYRGQWLHGMRHGYGVRQSVPYSLAVHYRPKGLDSSKSSVHTDHEDDPQIRTRDRKVDQGRGGFVLKAKSDQEATGQRRKSLFDRQGGASLRQAIAKTLRRDRSGQRSGSAGSSPAGTRRRTSAGRQPTGSVRSTDSQESVQSGTTDSNASFVSQDEVQDATVVETYAGEWKTDKRCGHGVSERSDGLKYEGEWFNNKKNGYGVTTLQDGKKEEGKYKDNELTSAGKKSKLFLVRSNKMRERIDVAVAEAAKASEIAIQKTGVAISRMAAAKGRAEMAEKAAEKARADAEVARLSAKEYHDIPLVIEMSGNVSSKLDSTSSNEAGSDAWRTTDALDWSPDGRSGASKEKRGSKSLLLNAFSAALKRRQSSEMPSNVGSSPRRSLVSSSPEDLEDRRSDELNRRNRSKVSSDEKLNNNTADYNKPETDDDIIRKTHIIAQRLNRASVDLTGSSPKRRLNSVSWVTPEADTNSRPPTQNDRPPTSTMQTKGPPTTTPTDEAKTSPTSPAFSCNFESETTGNSRSPSFSDGGRPRESSLTTIDEDEAGSQMRMGLPSDRKGPPVLRSKQTPEVSSPREGVGLHDVKSRRLTLPSLIKVTQPLIKVSSPDPSPINASERHRGMSQSHLRHDNESHPSGKSPTASDTYAIINGVRTLVRPANEASPAAAGYPSPDRAPSGGPISPGIAGGGEDGVNPDEPSILPSRYILEPVAGRTSDLRNRGSLPELFDLQGLRGGLSREEAHLLSERRREQLRREREEREKRCQFDIVLSFGDIKDWWRERQLMMVVIAINIGLAAVFINLLSR